MRYIFTDATLLKGVFIFLSVIVTLYIINNDEYKKYNRTGEKLQLIEKGQYKPNL